MIHKAGDLSPDQRVAIESLIGQKLSEQDSISVRRLPPPGGPTPEKRREIGDGLSKYFAQVDAQRQPMSDEEAEETVNEALRLAKPAYRAVS
jgi:hypothetical protein